MTSQNNQNKIYLIEGFLIKNQKLLLVFLIGLSFVIKLFFLNFYAQPYFFDVQTYIEAVEFFLKGISFSDVIMPLYPIVVYIAEKILNIQIFNILFSCLTIFITFQLLSFIYNKIIFKFLIILIIAFYPFNIFYSITGFSETFYVLFLTTTLLFFYKDKIFLATLFGSLALLIKPVHFYPLLFFIFYFQIYYFKKEFKKSVFTILACGAILILVMSPWWIFNYNKYNKFIMFNLSSTLTLFIGNNPLNKTGGGTVVDDHDIKNFPKRFSKSQQDFSYDLLKGYPGFSFDENKKKVIFIEGVEGAIDRHKSYLKYSQKYIFDNPDKFIELVFKKFVRFWRLWPYSQEYNSFKYIIISLLSYGPFLILFIIYTFKFISKFEKHTFPLILMIFYFSFVHMILISSIRYRFPIENFIIILGVYFLMTEIGKKTKLR